MISWEPLSTSESISENDILSESLSKDTFAFHGLDSEGFCVQIWDGAKQPPPERSRGNYVASDVLAQLRIRANASGRRWTNLEPMFNLPNELIFLILEFLHPIDLYHIIQTTRTLRSLLLGKSAKKIWEQSFLLHSDIPFYPKDVSAPKWASLLFGPSTCDGCGCNNTLVDFVYRERKCLECQSLDLFYPHEEDLYVDIQPMLDRFPVIDEDIFRLVRKTYKTKSANFYPNPNKNAHSTPKYSKKDILARAQEMYILLEAISSGASGAHEAYDKFEQETRATTQEYLEHIESCESWAYSIMTQCLAEFRESVRKIHDICEKILKNRGHAVQDVKEAAARSVTDTICNWSSYTYPKLRKKFIWKILPKLESTVSTFKEIRLECQRQECLMLRGTVVLNQYTSTAQTHLKPDIGPYLPPPSLLGQLPLFHDYINDAQEIVGELPAEQAQEQILCFVHSVIKDKKRHLVNLLQDAGIANPDSNGEDPFDVLNLAVAIFECCHTRHLPKLSIGWEEAGRGLCFGDEDTLVSSDYNLNLGFQFQFCTTGYLALQNLANLLKLDLRSVRAKDLDAMKRRFFCKTCPIRWQAGALGLDSMDWRECLRHTLDAQMLAGLENCRTPAFDVASDELTRSILVIEKPHPSPTEKVWYCKRCNAHFRKYVIRAEAVAHVKETHEVYKPTAGEDFTHCPTMFYEQRKMIFVGLDEHSNHRCLRCPQQRQHRLWQLENLHRHLADAHHIEKKHLVEGVDWTKIQPMRD